MLHDSNAFPSEDALVRRYENMINKKAASYFDLEEFEELANYYLQINQPNKAKQVVGYAEKQHPLNEALVLIDARILVAMDKLNDAIVMLRKSERRLKHDCDYWMLTGEVCIKLTWISVADDAFEKVLETCSKSDYSQFCIEISYFFSAADKITLSLKYLHRAYSLTPNDLTIIDELAGIYTDLNQYDNAEELLLKHIDLDPFSMDAWFSLGLIYFDHTYEYDKALDAFKYAVTVDESFEMAQFFVGQVLMKLRRYEEAIEAFKEYEEITGQKEQAYFLYAECYEELEEYHDAIDSYRKAIELGGDRKEALIGIGYCFYDLQEYNDAMATFKLVIDLDDKRSEEAWSGIGDCLQELGMVYEAHDAYGVSINLNPKQADVYITFADSLIDAGDVKHALRVIEQGLVYSPANNELLLKKAECYFKLDGVYSACIILQQLAEDNVSLDSFYECVPEIRFNEKAISFFGW